ncbi:hypothetical protein KFK09_011966 [Dendrobium nobile]|uniref:Reverse transcriptase domain-containing protein n=1 Tax=Dendrobium nobile TaxID=94219 RepID=A0A8T3BGI5_DENNO|nr:hypothetical protein KFK09_011966 [Dendrobium nobile]
MTNIEDGMKYLRQLMFISYIALSFSLPPSLLEARCSYHGNLLSLFFILHIYLRGLMETYRERIENLHIIFIDLEKAYDKVTKEMPWRDLYLRTGIYVFTGNYCCWILMFSLQFL